MFDIFSGEGINTCGKLLAINGEEAVMKQDRTGMIKILPRRFLKKINDE